MGNYFTFVYAYFLMTQLIYASCKDQSYNEKEYNEKTYRKKEYAMQENYHRSNSRSLIYENIVVKNSVGLKLRGGPKVKVNFIFLSLGRRSI